MMSVLMALAIGSVITIGQIEGQRTQQQLTTGRIQGDLLLLMRDAVNTYAMENYPALQMDQPVTKEGVTLNNGTADGQSFSPTVANLVAMGYLAPGTNAGASINSGQYRVRLTKIPLGCVGTTCNITGTVYIDQPVTRPGSNQIHGMAVGSLIDKVGGDAMVALNTAPGELVGMSGANMANPLGTREGVVGARVGFGSSAFGRFLIVGDPRDPNFQGNLTVAGNTNLGGTLNVAGNTTLNQNLSVAGTSTVGGAATFNGPVTTNSQLTANGPVQVNNSLTTTGPLNVNNCFRVTSDGRAATNCLDPLDLPPGWGGGLRAWDTVTSGSAIFTPNPSAGADWNNGQPWTLVSRDSEAAVFANGRMAARRFIPAGQTFDIGSACSEPGAIARATPRGSGEALAFCRADNLRWENLISSSSAGAGCATSGMLGVDGSGQQMICQQGIWMLSKDRMGHWSASQSTIVSYGSVIGKPGCGSGGTPAIFANPQYIDTRSNASNFQALDVGWAWVINMVDGNGAPVATTAQAQTGCWYN